MNIELLRVQIFECVAGGFNVKPTIVSRLGAANATVGDAISTLVQRCQLLRSDEGILMIPICRWPGCSAGVAPLLHLRPEHRDTFKKITGERPGLGHTRSDYRAIAQGNQCQAVPSPASTSVQILPGTTIPSQSAEGSTHGGSQPPPDASPAIATSPAGTRESMEFAANTSRLEPCPAIVDAALPVATDFPPPSVESSEGCDGEATAKLSIPEVAPMSKPPCRWPDCRPEPHRANGSGGCCSAAASRWRRVNPGISLTIDTPQSAVDDAAARWEAGERAYPAAMPEPKVVVAAPVLVDEEELNRAIRLYRDSEKERRAVVEELDRVRNESGAELKRLSELLEESTQDRFSLNAALNPLLEDYTGGSYLDKVRAMAADWQRKDSEVGRLTNLLQACLIQIGRPDLEFEQLQEEIRSLQYKANTLKEVCIRLRCSPESILRVVENLQARSPEDGPTLRLRSVRSVDDVSGQIRAVLEGDVVSLLPGREYQLVLV